MDAGQTGKPPESQTDVTFETAAEMPLRASRWPAPSSGSATSEKT